MNPKISIERTVIETKQYNGKRVVTFYDIDMVHRKLEGTARNRFNNDKERFIEGIDYFMVSPVEIRNHKIFDICQSSKEDVTLLTESGYILSVKLLTDDLSWKVERILINEYFNTKDNNVKQAIKKYSSLKKHFKIANMIIKCTGINKKVAYGTAIHEAEKESGCPMGAYRELLR